MEVMMVVESGEMRFSERQAVNECLSVEDSNFCKPKEQRRAGSGTCNRVVGRHSTNSRAFPSPDSARFAAVTLADSAAHQTPPHQHVRQVCWSESNT